MRGWVRGGAGSVLLAGSLLVGGSPAQAAPDWHPAPGAAPDAATYAYFEPSAAGEPMSLGQTSSFTLENADITVAATGERVDVAVDGEGGAWTVAFEAPDPATTVAVGRHESLPNRPSTIGRGFVKARIDAQARYCTPSNRSWFAVDEVAYDGAELSHLKVRFEQYCGGPGVLHGEILWDADVPVPPAPVPTEPIPATMAPYPDASVPGLRYMQMSTRRAGPDQNVRTKLYDTPEEVRQVEAGWNRVGRYLGAQNTESDQYQIWELLLSTRAELPEHGFYDDLAQAADPVRGTFTSTYGDCAATVTDVAIDEIDIRGGKVTDLSMRYEEECTRASEGAFSNGHIRWQPDPVHGAPATPTDVSAVLGDDDTVEVGWAYADGDDTYPVLRFEVTTYRDGMAVATDEVGPEARTATIDDLDPGVPYTFKVHADAGQLPNQYDTWSPGDGLRTRATAPIVIGDVPDPSPFATVEDLVAQQYLDFAGRPPTGSELATAAASLRAGDQTPDAFIAGMRTRPEWAPRRSTVIRLYSAYFARPPDTAGLDYWVGELAAGTTVNQVSQAFAASREFRTMYGSLTNREFVRRVYVNVLGRQPDAAGLEYWTARLDGGTSRGAVMTGFSESAENKVRTQPAVDVTLILLGMVRRAPDRAGLEGYLSFVDGGATMADVAGMVRRGTEYADRVT